jgi:hypothetical protein
MAQAVSRQPLTAEARGSVRVGFVMDKVVLGQVSPQILRFSPVSFMPPVLHYKEKWKKTIIFITGLHSKPQGCGASVPSAAGPLTKKKKKKKKKTRSLLRDRVPNSTRSQVIVEIFPLDPF